MTDETKKPDASETPAADQPEEGKTAQEPAADSGQAGDGGEGSSDGESAGRMGLFDHLIELRKRLVRAFLAVAVGFLACYAFAEDMFLILMNPMMDALTKIKDTKHVLSPDFFEQFSAVLQKAMADLQFQYADQIPVFMDAVRDATVKVVVQQGHFIYTYPPEAFFAHVKVALVAGVFLASPYIFYQLWVFVAPGLYSHERKWVVPMAVISALFFVTGALFGYFVVFPFGFDFFASYATPMVSFTPKLSEYLGFSLKLLFAFGLVFEMPLFVFFLARLGMVNSKGMRKKRKYAILVAFVVAAILTPPDPFTQSLMAGPLILLYELSIWVAFFFGRERKKREAEAAEAAESGE